MRLDEDQIKEVNIRIKTIEEEILPHLRKQLSEFSGPNYAREREAIEREIRRSSERADYLRGLLT